MLDPTDPNFIEDFNFLVWSTQSNSDYSNDKNRPYNGQPWTDDGERGKTTVVGLTMRDIRDCLIKAMLLSSSSEKYLNEDYLKCWDFSKCENDGDKPTPTEYLLERQNEPDYISTKVELGTWRVQDVYKINWKDIDPIAITQNLSCEIEKMMGIYPNIKNINKEEI